MRIYLTNEWLELPLSDDALSRIPEEYIIADTEGIPFSVGEYDDIHRLNEKLEQYEALDDYEQLSLSYLLDQGYDWQYSLDNYEDVIVYADQSLEDVAYSLVEDGCFGRISESLSNYIDYEAIARDLLYDGYAETKEGVFCYV